MPKKKKAAKKKAPATKARGSYGVRRGGKTSGMKGKTSTRKKRR